MTVTENIGFIGTGGLASAMAKGFCTSTDFKGKVLLSVNRNPARAEELKRLFPDRVEICRSNQEVADGARIVAPCLLPTIFKEVMANVKFNREHHIIHVAAGTALACAKEYCAPAAHVVRTVPMPFASLRVGPLLFYGEDPLLERTLECIGTVFKVDTEEELAILASVTGLMVPYYGLVAELAKWCSGKKMGLKHAADYICLMNEALSVLMIKECGEDTDAFMKENTTPGGTNELALEMLRDADAYAPWIEAIEKVGKRYGL
jgi:pyrroline-5-carboxylate reductase